MNEPAADLETAQDLHPSNGPRSRRAALRLLGGAGIGLVAAACSAKGSTSASTSSSTTSTTSTVGSSAAATAASCSTIPDETAGPYPGDGSNGKNVLDQDGVVRSDIRSSFGSSTTTAQGVPLTLVLQVVDTSNGCQPKPGAAVYVWHCDRDGNYSMYSGGASKENYLRGVQVADADGTVRFTSIFPACYSGRWPHVHFEVYPSVDDATAAENKLATSQLAFPEEVCDTVYATDGYSSSVRTFNQVSLSSDGVFRDGVSLQTPTMSGNADDGLVATLVVPV
jgi:protocatechuate 3,4-dioxygenase beta subunit